MDALYLQPVPALLLASTCFSFLLPSNVLRTLLGLLYLLKCLANLKVRAWSAAAPQIPDEHDHFSQRAPWLRAGVLGANDGLVSVASLMLGVGGGSDSLHIVVLAGVAGLIGGALSMAVGEYISVSSQRCVILSWPLARSKLGLLSCLLCSLCHKPRPVLGA